MKHLRPFVCLFLALTVPGILQAAPPDAADGLPACPFHLESKPEQQWDLTLTQPHGPFRGVVYYPVPPSNPCQSIISAALYAETREGRIEAVRVGDMGPLKKPLFKLDIQASAPFTVVAHVVVQLHRTALATGPIPHPLKPLGSVQRAQYLNDGWPNEHARTWFRQWMQSRALIRGKGEAEAEFAFRVLKFMQGHFRYVIPDNIPAHQEMVKKDPVLGDWRYTISTSTGECWRLSDTYCRVMRMNGIPARLVSGNFFGGDTGHHLRSLVYLQDVGWVPVEATAAISSPKNPPIEFFGTWGGTMLIGNQNIDFILKGPKGRWNIGTLDGLAFGSVDGKWDFPDVHFAAKVVPDSTQKSP